MHIKRKGLKARSILRNSGSFGDLRQFCGRVLNPIFNLFAACQHTLQIMNLHFYVLFDILPIRFAIDIVIIDLASTPMDGIALAPASKKISHYR
jgi:hypothetical protein